MERCYYGIQLLISRMFGVLNQSLQFRQEPIGRVAAEWQPVCLDQFAKSNWPLIWRIGKALRQAFTSWTSRHKWASFFDQVIVHRSLDSEGAQAATWGQGAVPLWQWPLRALWSEYFPAKGRCQAFSQTLSVISRSPIVILGLRPPDSLNWPLNAEGLAKQNSFW